MSRRAKRLVQWAVGVGGSVAVLAGLAAAAFRMYSPGTLDDRLARAASRWRPFTEALTWRFLGSGLLLTLRLALVSIVVSLVLAVVLALVRLSSSRQLGSRSVAGRVLRVPAGVVVEVVRSLPLFMIITYMYLGVPQAGVNLTPVVAGTVALTLYTSAVMSEIVRAGILSLDRGQFEAAAALGLSYGQRLRHIVLPQALRRMVPAIVSQLATLVKDTSLVSTITVFELARRGRVLQEFNANPIESFLVVAAIYFVMIFALSEVARRLERRPGLGGARLAALGEEDQVAVAPAAGSVVTP